MPETALADLEPRLQKQLAGARAAFDQGRSQQAAELCTGILEIKPDCLKARKLERAARLKQASSSRSPLPSRAVNAVSAAPFLLGGHTKLKDNPLEALLTADRLLRTDPRSVAALSLLGEAATALGWRETAVFAHEAASDLESGRADIWVALGGSYFCVGRTADAASAAYQAILLQPANAEAQGLLQVAIDAEVFAAEQSGKPPGVDPAWRAAWGSASPFARAGEQSAHA